MQASNYVQKGRVLPVTAPYTRVAGEAAMIGSLLGVAQDDVASGKVGYFDFEGVWSLKKTSAQSWTLGDKIYWNASTKLVSNVQTDGPLVGVAVAAAANPSATGKVRLNGTAPQAALATTVVGDQEAIDDLVDDSGAVATPDGTIGAVTAPNLSAWDGNTSPTSNEGGAIASAIVAQTNAIAELAAKINAILATLRAAGLIVDSE